MRRRNHFAAFVLTFCLAVACTLLQASADEQAKPSKPAQEELAAHPVRQADYWSGFETRPWADRLQPAAPEFIDFLRKDNLLQGYPQQPRPAHVDERYLADLRAALQDIPAALRVLVSDKFVALILVEELGGSGYMESVIDAEGQPVAAFLVLDPVVLDRNANAWASWRDSTPFTTDPAYEIQTRLEEPAGDTRRNALRYILLHEFGHFVGMDPAIHPSWSQEPTAEGLAAARFASLSWIYKDGDHVSRFDSDFTLRPKIVFYGGDDTKLPLSDAESVLRALSKTDFPTPYAATSTADDFAESLASYIHVVVDRRPYWIEVSKNGEALYRFESCWGTPRCAAKEKILFELLAVPKER